jgi:type III pantothenate kinase
MEPSNLKLIIDSGNTRLKLHLFKGKTLVFSNSLDPDDTPLAEQFINHHGPFKSAIISNVAHQIPLVVKSLEAIIPVIYFDHSTPIPIKNLYQTPETLGPDRLAAAIGGHTLFPHHPVLVIDAGTCINYELVVNGAYLGGLIAPGIGMQANALHHFTGKLPLVSPTHNSEPPLTGSSTQEVLLSGIINGTLASINGIIEQYAAVYDDLMIILSGGDLFYFDKRLKNRIFAAPNIVAQGLNEILDFHESN